MKSPETDSDADFYLLVAFPNRSDILHVNIDSSEVAFKSQEEVWYDLSSSTLAVEELDDGTIVQVTPGSITVMSLDDR